jgi:hypothetical protein
MSDQQRKVSKIASEVEVTDKGAPAPDSGGVLAHVLMAFVMPCSIMNVVQNLRRDTRRAFGGKRPRHCGARRATSGVDSIATN